MQHSELVALLAAGSIPATELEAAADDGSVSQPPKYNGMLDPQGAETLGRVLAEALASYDPTRVLIWEDPPDLILAHVVARELSATVVRAFDADGLVAFTGDFSSNARAVLLADTFRDPRVVQALAALVHQQHGDLVATAELFTVSGAAENELPDVPAVVLDRMAAVSGPTGGAHVTRTAKA